MYSKTGSAFGSTHITDQRQGPPTPATLPTRARRRQTKSELFLLRAQNPATLENLSFVLRDSAGPASGLCLVELPAGLAQNQGHSQMIGWVEFVAIALLLIVVGLLALILRGSDVAAIALLIVVGLIVVGLLALALILRGIDDDGDR